MKKWISALTAAALLIALIGCASDTPAQTSERKKKKTSVTTELTQPQTSQSGSISVTTDPNVPEVPPKKRLDPFEGLKFEVAGISPFCKIVINNANCDSDVQFHVTYTLDKETYANGDEAIITASVDQADEYELISETATYKVENQPEYITSVDGVDLTFLESERNDFVTAGTSAALQEFTGLFDYTYGWDPWESIDSVNNVETWFATIKKTKLSSDALFYNSINYIYSIDVTRGGNPRTYYVNVSCYNIIKYPDGTLKWGNPNPDSYEFKTKTQENGVDDLVATTITVLASDYNLSKIYPK